MMYMEKIKPTYTLAGKVTNLRNKGNWILATIEIEGTFDDAGDYRKIVNLNILCPDWMRIGDEIQIIVTEKGL